jgi:hypothetical protein
MGALTVAFFAGKGDDGPRCDLPDGGCRGLGERRWLDLCRRAVFGALPAFDPLSGLPCPGFFDVGVCCGRGGRRGFDFLGRAPVGRLAPFESLPGRPFLGVSDVGGCGGLGERRWLDCLGRAVVSRPLPFDRLADLPFLGLADRRRGWFRLGVLIRFISPSRRTEAGPTQDDPAMGTKPAHILA